MQKLAGKALELNYPSENCIQATNYQMNIVMAIMIWDIVKLYFKSKQICAGMVPNFLSHGNLWQDLEMYASSNLTGEEFSLQLAKIGREMQKDLICLKSLFYKVLTQGVWVQNHVSFCSHFVTLYYFVLVYYIISQ